MAPLEIQNTTVTNKLARNVFFLFPPAPPLEIPANASLLHFSAIIEKIFVSEGATDGDAGYILRSWLLLETGSTVSIVDGDDGPVLEYRKAGTTLDKKMILVRKFRGLQLHKDVRVRPLETNDRFHDNIQSGNRDTQDAFNGQRAITSPARPLTTQEELKVVSDLRKHFDDVIMNPSETDLANRASKPDVIPATASVIIVPEGETMDPAVVKEIKEAHQDLKHVLSVISMLSALRIKEAEAQRGRPINSIEETALWMEITADASFKAVYDPAFSKHNVLWVESQTSERFERVCQRGDVHSLFLNELLSEFKFDPSAYEELDRVLTRFAQRVAKGNIGASDTLSFNLIRPWIPIQQIPGTTLKSVEPRIKMFFIRASASTFLEIISRGKRGSVQVENTTLKFDYNIKTIGMNRDKFRENKWRFDRALHDITGQDLQSLEDKTSVSVRGGY